MSKSIKHVSLSMHIVFICIWRTKQPKLDKGTLGVVNSKVLKINKSQPRFYVNLCYENSPRSCFHSSSRLWNRNIIEGNSSGSLTYRKIFISYIISIEHKAWIISITPGTIEPACSVRQQLKAKLKMKSTDVITCPIHNWHFHRANFTKASNGRCLFKSGICWCIN